MHKFLRMVMTSALGLQLGCSSTEADPSDAGAVDAGASSDVQLTGDAPSGDAETRDAETSDDGVAPDSSLCQDDDCPDGECVTDQDCVDAYSSVQGPDGPYDASALSCVDGPLPGEKHCRECLADADCPADYHCNSLEFCAPDR